MPELVAFWMLVAALLFGTIGWLWLLVTAFRTHLGWGCAVLLFPPAAVVFVPIHFRRALVPTLLLVLSAGLFAVPFGINYYYEHHVDLGPRERIVDGELHITLTGWESSDYSVLKARPQTVVLQMANADVDDRMLEYVKGMQQLRELDLNDTQVSDEGLRILAGLPALEKLRLRKTKITDAGFREHMLPKETLLELDLTGTAVASATVREWRGAKAGRRALR